MQVEDKLRQIEEKTGRLIGEIDSLRKNNASLQERETAAMEKSREADSLRDENARLRQRVAQLETEISDAGEKEKEIRERLHAVIRKIDALEAMPESE